MSEVQSSAISKIKSIWKRLGDKEYRDAFVSFKIDSDLSAQIYALRDQQSLTQEDLGARASMAQSRIAKLEASCEGVSLSTLKRLASALDVALSVKFVPFSEVAADTVRENIDRVVPSFSIDRPPMETFRISTAAGSGRDYLPDLRAGGGGHAARMFRTNSNTKIFQDTVNG